MDKVRLRNQIRYWWREGKILVYWFGGGFLIWFLSLCWIVSSLD